MANVLVERSKLQRLKRLLSEAEGLLKEILDEPDEAEEAPFDGDDDKPTEGLKTATCKRCKTSGLRWKETNNGWRLFTPDGFMHRCPYYEDRR